MQCNIHIIKNLNINNFINTTKKIEFIENKNIENFVLSSKYYNKYFLDILFIEFFTYLNLL